MNEENDKGLYSFFTDKGIIPLSLTGVILIGVGFFLITQSLVGGLLPHDVASLQMTAAQLSVFNNGTILKFMFHDRIAFGGSLIALGIVYIWLASFPLKKGQAWAWWLFLISGVTGFGSFLTYMGYGYLDTWHCIGTLLLLPVFILGIIYAYKALPAPKGIHTLFIKRNDYSLRTKEGIGYSLLLFIAGGIFLAGIVIMYVGMTMVFVPQDLDYMKINTCGLSQINPRLIPIIAHDRASFGGGLATTGLLLFFCLRCYRMSRSLWELLALSMSIGFGTAIGVHFWISYLDFTHLAPAYLGLLLFYAGLILIYRKNFGRGPGSAYSFICAAIGVVNNKD